MLNLVVAYTIIFSAMASKAINPDLDLSDHSNHLLYTTVRIEASDAKGRSSVGTAFFFDFKIDEKEHVPVLITNKHVVEKMTIGTFLVHKARKDATGKFVRLGASETLTITNFEKAWICHPHGLDVCAMPIAPLLLSAQKAGFEVFRSPFGEDLIPSQEKLLGLRAIEDITMIGYPIGLWDKVNNYPIVRRGITATHPGVDFNGKPEGVIDIAAFPGSSGSPILIFNQGGYTGKGGGFVVGNRIMLLGLLWGGPVISAEGKISIVEVPTKQEPVATTSIAVHMGYYIKAREMLELKAELFKKLNIGKG